MRKLDRQRKKDQNNDEMKSSNMSFEIHICTIYTKRINNKLTYLQKKHIKTIIHTFHRNTLTSTQIKIRQQIVQHRIHNQGKQIETTKHTNIQNIIKIRIIKNMISIRCIYMETQKP
jgi:hypothetical protein